MHEHDLDGRLSRGGNVLGNVVGAGARLWSFGGAPGLRQQRTDDAPSRSGRIQGDVVGDIFRRGEFVMNSTCFLGSASPFFLATPEIRGGRRES